MAVTEETSARYLKRTVQQRSRRRSIPCLRHPVTAAMCHSRDDMLQAASPSTRLYIRLAPQFQKRPDLSFWAVLTFERQLNDIPIRVALDPMVCLIQFFINTALTYGIFPPSWYDTHVSLLPKKGDSYDLRNWRPISLINTEAKMFTRLLNTRLLSAVSSLITPYQTGFMRGRFIAENGLLMKLIMDHCSQTRSEAVGLHLD
ncbi:hypothetical protein G6F56_001395 [Rhizopus delemar]|nr:hypothetical protein G6F56_001395 [Rhizopus delemar]